jgi:hypothetical protein
MLAYLKIFLAPKYFHVFSLGESENGEMTHEKLQKSH